MDRKESEAIEPEYKYRNVCETLPEHNHARLRHCTRGPVMMQLMTHAMAKNVNNDDKL